jgi:hypothetical protein
VFEGVGNVSNHNFLFWEGNKKKQLGKYQSFVFVLFKSR